MLSQELAAPAYLSLNAVNHIVHALVVRGVLDAPQAGQLLTDVAKSTRDDEAGKGGDVLANWLDEAAKQYRA